MRQEIAFQILKTEPAVFLTGAAGSGKTYLLNRFIEETAPSRKIAVTASTGLAASHLGGVTIHSWSGIGIRDELLTGRQGKVLIKENNIRPGRLKDIRETDILIIDEISMLHDYRLDMVDQICRLARNPDKPFGGLQVIFSGDFCQLTPINRPGSRQGRLAVYSRAWQELQPTVCYLDSQHRQDDDLIEILNQLRSNRLADGSLRKLAGRVKLKPEKDITELYCHNRDVDNLNQARLDELDYRKHSFLAQGKVYPEGSKQDLLDLKRICPAADDLHLKNQALVMFIKNQKLNYQQAGDDPSAMEYVNGTLGKVVGFSSKEDHPIVRTQAGHRVAVKYHSWEMNSYLNGRQVVKASYYQIPLILAWATTVHKSQGMTLDAASIDLSRAFEDNMGYVALSRVKSLDGLFLKGFNERALAMNPESLRLEAQFKRASLENKVGLS